MHPTFRTVAPVLLWGVLLTLPSLWRELLETNAAPPQWKLVLLSAWLAGFGFAWLPRRVFVVIAVPVAAAGIAAIGLYQLQGVSLLGLLSVWPTFGAEQVLEAARAYGWLLALPLASLCAMAVPLWNSRVDFGPRARKALIGVGVALAAGVPAEAWQCAWPIVLGNSLLEGEAFGDRQMPNWPQTRFNPRQPFATWGARRETQPPGAETYVFVIGETIRADRIPGCGGRAQIHRPPEGALLFCDMTSGANSTAQSVPLLVSREIPGQRYRVSADATFLRAFEEAGFSSHWLSVQHHTVAWADAQHQAYVPHDRIDRHKLMPLLEQALADKARRKVIVLHMMGAHDPYALRFEESLAPFPQAAGSGGRQRVLDDYDNAVDETLRFLAAVAGRVGREPGEAFLFFTADHGENLLDDARGLQLHSQAHPTMWATMVPAIAWANSAWRERNRTKWQWLGANQASALMHMDVVPTLLGAASIRYADPRTIAFDLSARLVPAGRRRFTMLRREDTVGVEQLRREAGVEGG